MGFLLDYFGVSDEKIETQVLCPFPHHTDNGITYEETHPSASINTTNNLFYCQACGTGLSEVQFIERVLGTTYPTAKKLQHIFQNEEDALEWRRNTELSDNVERKCETLGISTPIIRELELASLPEDDTAILFPVFMYGHLIDIRTYRPGETPKIKSRYGCPSGLILPYDLWETTPKNKITLICAGEKDMAVARSIGFNAITLTGGEQTLPNFIEPFRNRSITIVYDNDDAGRTGAIKLANHLSKVTDRIRVCTSFHEGMQDKEDITDYFVKYKHTKEDLINCIKETEIFEPSELYSEKPLTPINLLTATQPKNVDKLCKSNIQVVAVSETTFNCPTNVVLEKYRLGSNDHMHEGEIREWKLETENLKDILHLIDNNFTESQINEHLRDLMYVLKKEQYVKKKILKTSIVFKAYVTDMLESNNLENTSPMEYTCYSIDQKLESGKKYMVTYKLVPHPYKGNQLIMLIINADEASDSVSDYKVNADEISNLSLFQTPNGVSLEKHCYNLVERLKGRLGYNGNNQLIETIDLAYHTPLLFNFGTLQNIRGYLDTLIIGESRVGKSSTANCLRDLYGLGVFTSLAGNSATIPGLVGGSNKTASGYQTRAGVIPQNHKGLIIFEEFGKSNNSVITELTDIRSSNEVRITRVAGTITMPAMVRMIALTNPKVTNGQLKSIASYPNGVAVVTELVSTAEDIARYDIILVLADKGNTEFDPLWKPLEPLPDEAYKSRIRWVWSRIPEQIVWSEGSELYLMEQANELNKLYDCHIKIFGTEAWKKLARIAIAVAAYTVSTDESYERIIITNKHIDFAVKYMRNLYDNETFKYAEYVKHERQFTEIDEDGVSYLQTIYDKHPTLILQLEQSAGVSKTVLGAATGLSSDDLNKALNLLTKGLFIKFSNYAIIPTERFRKGLAKIERGTHVKRIGEP